MSRSHAILREKRPLMTDRVSETGSLSDRFLEFRPREQISKIRLQEIRLGLVRRRRGLTAVGNKHDSLRKLILRQTLALLPQLHYLLG